VTDWSVPGSIVVVTFIISSRRPATSRHSLTRSQVVGERMTRP
jgi:hypothetical protein